MYDRRDLLWSRVAAQHVQLELVHRVKSAAGTYKGSSPMITQRAGMFVVALSATTTLFGCATGERDDGGEDRQQQTLNNIPQQPSAAVCPNTGTGEHCL